MQLTLMDDEDRSDELLSSAEQIVATPGIPPHHKLYEKYGSKIISELNFLGARLNTQPRRSNISLIGVTGTDGKSTVSHILYHALKGVLPETNIWLSGNFDEPLGFTLSEIINGGLTEKKHIIVVECSSFMLYQLESLRFDYSVRTNISPDHLNRHPDMKDYVATKYRIFTHSTKGVFTTEGVMTTLSNLSLPLTHTAPLTIYTNEYPIDKTQFVGAHNA